MTTFTKLYHYQLHFSQNKQVRLKSLIVYETLALKTQHKGKDQEEDEEELDLCFGFFSRYMIFVLLFTFFRG